MVKKGEEDYARSIGERQQGILDKREVGYWGGFGEEPMFDKELDEVFRYLPLKKYFGIMRDFIERKGAESYGFNIKLPRSPEEDQGPLYYWACRLGYRKLFDRMTLQENDCVRVPLKHWVYACCMEFPEFCGSKLEARIKEGRNTGVYVGDGSPIAILEGVIEKARRDVGLLSGSGRYAEMPTDVVNYLKENKNAKLAQTHKVGELPRWSYVHHRNKETVEILGELRKEMEDFTSVLDAQKIVSLMWALKVKTKNERDDLGSFEDFFYEFPALELIDW